MYNQNFSFVFSNATTVAKVMTKEVDNSEFSIDSTSDLFAIEVKYGAFSIFFLMYTQLLKKTPIY